MALTDIFPVQADVVIPTSSYTSGGTNLGTLLSAQAVEFQKTADLVKKQTRGQVWQDVRPTGVNASFEFVLAERSAAVMDLIFGSDAVSGTDVRAFRNVKIGHLMKDADYDKILLRPTSVARSEPYLYFPRAAVLSVETVMWDEAARHLEAAKLIVVATDDGTEPWYYGDPTDFPAL